MKNGKYLKTYIPNTFELYEVAKYGEGEKLYKEFNMLKKLGKSRNMQITTFASWYGSICTDEKLEKLNKIINDVESGRKLEQETIKKFQII